MFFFFKQKTAYEMRISDWSSDVCSSDLLHQLLALGLGAGLAQLVAHRHALFLQLQGGQHLLHRLGADHRLEGVLAELLLGGEELFLGQQLMHLQRSEEHTSELQSLMRISYAVFCLKKKKKHINKK